MHILLLNANPVVSRLVQMVTSQMDITLEEVSHLSQVSRFAYDVVMVDEGVFDEDAKALLSALSFDTSIYIAGEEDNPEHEEAFDEVLRKPFLPSQVEHLIRKVTRFEDADDEADESETQEHAPQAQEAHEEEDDVFFMMEDDDEKDALHILDTDEVARIKHLLKESEEAEEIEEDMPLEERKVKAITENLRQEGLDIVEEEDIVQSLTESQERPHEKDAHMDAETFLALMQTLKPKKLRKLLKGATVTVQISFKD